MAVGSGEPDSEGAVRRSGLAMVAPLGEGVHAVQRHPLRILIIIIHFLFDTLTCKAGTWNGVIKSSAQICYCHKKVALSKAYNFAGFTLRIQL